MVSKGLKRAAMHKKLQVLRLITNPHARNKTSIILDASRYITDLKQKVERLKKEIETAEIFSHQNPLPQISIEEQDKDFIIKVFTETSCQGLLVLVLEAFEELGLDVLHARVSSSDCFVLEAIAAKVNNGADDIDAQVVKQAVLQAIQVGLKATTNS